MPSDLSRNANKPATHLVFKVSRLIVYLGEQWQSSDPQTLFPTSTHLIPSSCLCRSPLTPGLQRSTCTFEVKPCVAARAPASRGAPRRSSSCQAPAGGPGDSVMALLHKQTLQSFSGKGESSIGRSDGPAPVPNAIKQFKASKPSQTRRPLLPETMALSRCTLPCSTSRRPWLCSRSLTPCRKSSSLARR